MITETAMNVLMRPDLLEETATRIREELGDAGAQDVRVETRNVESACEPDNVLIAEYSQRFDSPPIAEQVHLLTVTAAWASETATPERRKVTASVASCLPPAPDGTPGLWSGQTTALPSSE